MKFELYSRLGLFGRRWRWRLKAANGEIIATGEAYFNRNDALKAIQLVKGVDSATPCREV